MADIRGIGAVDEALQGDMSRLLQRLRDSDLSQAEKQFIENRLTGKGAAIKKGAKKSSEISHRNQEILIADAWLEFRFGCQAASERREYIASKLNGLTGSGIRNIISETNPTLITKLYIDTIKKMRLVYGRASESAHDKPAILRDAPITPN